MGEHSSVSFAESNLVYQSADPNLLFLSSTLLFTGRRLVRESTSYFPVRGWRKELKPLQIAAVRNIKVNPTEAALSTIAKEIADYAATVTNGSPYDFVCGVPPGTSRSKENFAMLIARAVADRMNIDFSAALRTTSTGKGRSSHPQESVRFRVRLEDDVPDGKIALLVDDVTTTGSHFRRCVDQFRRKGMSVVCVSWIG
ncbi:phosphoribosyltransferase [Chelativorans sp. Marseille-P2723]|uniref:phosphoribosyltransferase n=1 Tax=Chelativorans sp. Marseille-P2723 TaxID=2709133 RepID=UPI00156E74D4|nr:phosphoribosyltransferase [Chelativorans sp. Marseille-P2723]